MTQLIGTGIRSVCWALDVPVCVAAELYATYGEEVWWCLVENTQTRLGAGVRGARFVLKGEGLVGHTARWGALLLGLRSGVSGVRVDVARDERCPDWLVKWLCDEGWMHEEELAELVHGPRSDVARWYLASKADLAGGIRREAKKLYRKETLGRSPAYSNMLLGAAAAWRLMYDKDKAVLEAEEAFGGMLGSNKEERMDREQVVHDSREREAAAGRSILGDGASTQSLVIWARFLDLVQAGVSCDLLAMMDAATRSFEVAQ